MPIGYVCRYCRCLLLHRELWQSARFTDEEREMDIFHELLHPVPEINDRLAAFCCDVRVGTTAHDGSGVWLFSKSGTRLCRRLAWNPCEDRNHVALVLEECRRRGWLMELTDILWDAWETDLETELGFNEWLFTAPPETICRAVVAVLEQKARA